LLLLGLAVLAGSLAVLPAAVRRATPDARADGGARAGDAADRAVEVLGSVEVRSAAVPVVRVVANGCGGRSVGSGVLLDGGRVLTARHVLDGASSASVELGGRRVTGRVVALDGSGRDAALLDASALGDVPGAAVARSSPSPDDVVRVLGHPRGGPLEERTGPVVGRLDSGPLALDGGPVLTLDVVVAEGMSGGPVVDRSGAVVGVAVGYEQNTRTGLAVPVDDLTALLAGSGETARAAC
jgi:S1-C subfamily serine protease